MPIQTSIYSMPLYGCVHYLQSLTDVGQLEITIEPRAAERRPLTFFERGTRNGKEKEKKKERKNERKKKKEKRDRRTKTVTPLTHIQPSGRGRKRKNKQQNKTHRFIMGLLLHMILRRRRSETSFLYPGVCYSRP